MGYLVIGVFAVACALIYWLLIYRQTKKLIKQIRESTNQAIDEINQETQQLIDEISDFKETARSSSRR